MGFYQKDMILQKYLSKEEEYRFHDKGKRGGGAYRVVMNQSYSSILKIYQQHEGVSQPKERRPIPEGHQFKLTSQKYTDKAMAKQKSDKQLYTQIITQKTKERASITYYKKYSRQHF